MAEIQLTRILHLDNGTTALEPILEGPPTDGSVILLPALAWFAAPPEPDPQDDPALGMSGEHTDWLYRIWQAIENLDAASVDWLVDSVGGIEAVHRAFRERLGVDLPAFGRWTDIRVTATQIAQVHGILEHLVQSGRQNPRIVRGFSNQTHHDTSNRIGQAWADITCQPAARVTSTIASGISTSHDQIFATLVLTAPRAGLALSTEGPLTRGLAERYAELPGAGERAAMLNDLVTPLITTGIQIAVDTSTLDT